jgi:hypothetical protein
MFFKIMKILILIKVFKLWWILFLISLINVHYVSYNYNHWQAFFLPTHFINPNPWITSYNFMKDPWLINVSLTKCISIFNFSFVSKALLCISFKDGSFEDFVEFTNFRVQGLSIACEFMLSINLGFGFKVLHFWF